MSKRIYVAGKITGDTDYLGKFNACQEVLEAKGYEVINPAKVLSCLPELKHEQYMRICMPMIDACDRLCMIPGWERSQGAMCEYAYAIATGKETFRYEDEVKP